MSTDFYENRILKLL